MRYYLLILLTSLLPFIHIFVTPDMPYTHDGLVHIPRLAAYYKALSDFQIPVRWAGDLNYGYGLPLFNFMYQTPYIIGSFFIFLGFNLITSFKLILLISFIFSGIWMFAFTKEFFKDETKALLVTVFYQFFPFRLVELLVRGSIGEVYTYTFLPLVLFGILKFLRTSEYKYFFLGSLAVGLLILSHNSVSLLFFGVIALFLLFFLRKKKEVVSGFTVLSTGLFLSAFYWIPAIFEHRYTYGDLFMKKLYLEHFAPLLQFFIPNFIDSKEFQTGGISVQIGAFHVAALLLSIYVLSSQKKLENQLRRVTMYSIILFLISMFFMLPLSSIFWERVSILRQFQFPWRFLAVIGFSTSLLAVFFISLDFFQKKSRFYLLIFLVIVSTLYYWKPSLGYKKINEGYYWNFPLNTTYYGETDVIWSAGPAGKYPKSRIEVIDGKATVQNLIKKSNLQTFEVAAERDTVLVSNIQYFPGWRVYIDRKKVEPQFQDPNWRGLIKFPVTKGNHAVRIVFGESKVRLIADIVSIVTGIGLIVGAILMFVRARKRK